MVFDIKIHAKGLDPETMSQIYRISNIPAFEDGISIMPDAHAGAGCCIGFTAKIKDYICPNFVGVDIGCFRGNTKVPLLDGTQQTLEELVNKGEFYVYSMNEQLKIVPGKAIAAKTRTNAEVMKVVISGGEEIICTPDHKFMLINGAYKEAKDLKPQDSLMPLYRSYQTRDGYESIHSVHHRATLTHKMVYEHFNKSIDPTTEIVHHIDVKWYNNDPSNLIMMNKVEHTTHHRSLKCSFTAPEFQEKKMKTIKDRGYFFDEKYTEQRKEVAVKNITDYMKNNPEHFAESVKDNGKRGAKYLANWNTENNSKPVTCSACGKQLKKGGLGNHLKMHKREAPIQIHNHKVLYTESIAEKEDVYCLSVEKYHNFALSSGIFVHNCGVRGVFLGDIQIDYAALDAYLKHNIPLGMKHRDETPVLKDGDETKVLSDTIGVQNDIGMTKHYAGKQLGTLGGGNHFIEIGESTKTQDKWLFVHSGSRNFGLTVAEHYQKIAASQKLIPTPKGMEVLDINGTGADYLRDMRVAQRFAALNRALMVRDIIDYLDADIKYDIDCVHNFIAIDNIIRKGAISAYYREPVLIPLNMRDGTVIGKGLGNSDYNFSAPHGAGRMFGRGQMKRRLASGELTVEGFQNEMSGIFTTTANANTIDESPYAYKPYEMIKDYLEETVSIIDVVKPKYNLKGGD